MNHYMDFDPYFIRERDQQIRREMHSLRLGEQLRKNRKLLGWRLASITTSVSRRDLRARLVALSGFVLVGYGAKSFVRNFTGFIGLGLKPRNAGDTPEQIRTFSKDLYEYFGYEHVASSGFMVALGVVVIALAWYGIRKGERWALMAALLGPVIAVGVAVPLHFPYGIATIGHLGLIYLDALVLGVGTVLAYTGLRKVEG
jgi:hypothetical protein